MKRTTAKDVIEAIKAMIVLDHLPHGGAAHSPEADAAIRRDVAWEAEQVLEAYVRDAILSQTRSDD